MRIAEVMRLKHGALNLAGVKSGGSALGAKERMVSLLSTTTKYTGYRQECSWLAGGPVIKAIQFAEAICEGLAHSLDMDLQEVPLFLNPGLLCSKRSPLVRDFRSNKMPGVNPNIIITQADFEELISNDPDRDFSPSECQFVVGEKWPLRTHQYRRSLAFYASNSGFVSLTTLQSQFKYVSRAMAQYYSRGFENSNSLFGAYDNESGEFLVPKDHVMNEFQTGLPINKAHQILSQLLEADSNLFGGTGSYIQKYHKTVGSETNASQVRRETEKLVKEEVISFKTTLLGGCTKVEPCDSLMLGEFMECLTCVGSVIEPNKVVREIHALEDELCKHPPSSGEYQVVRSELEALK